MPASNGGIPAPLGLELFPATSFSPNGLFYFLDPTNFNDPLSSSFYNWKVEDIICGRTGTINRVIISYRDLGVVTFLVNLSGTNDQGKAVNNSQYVTVGNTVPLGVIMTKIVSLALTAQNLQLSIVRAANAGPLSITKVRMEGKVETTTY